MVFFLQIINLKQTVFIELLLMTIVSDPRAVSQEGEKVWQKFSSMRGRPTGYRPSPDHFQMFKWVVAPDWLQNMLCIILTN